MHWRNSDLYPCASALLSSPQGLSPDSHAGPIPGFRQMVKSTVTATHCPAPAFSWQGAVFESRDKTTPHGSPVSRTGGADAIARR